MRNQGLFEIKLGWNKYNFRNDVTKWEEFISACYVLLRALRGSIETLGGVYYENDYRAVVKTVAMDVSVVLDNYDMPTGW